MTATPISIRVFRNGDTHHAGAKIVMKATIKTMQQLYDTINKEVGLVTGSCRKIVTPENKVVNNLTDLVDGGNYVALAGEPLNKEKLPNALKSKAKAAAAPPAEHAEGGKPEGQAAEAGGDAAPAAEPKPEQEAAPKATAPAAKATASAPKTTAPASKTAAPKAAPAAAKASAKSATAAPKQQQKFGTQATTAKSILVFRNGDVHDSGTKITLKTTVTTLDKLYDIVNKDVHLVTGACRKIVRPDGTAITDLAQFEDGGKYIALAGEPLNKEKMSKNI